MSVFVFQPSVNSAFQFQPTLDGSQYVGTIIWNLFSQVWYLQLVDSSGAVVFNKPLVGSPSGAPIETVSYDEEALAVTLTTQVPHGYPIGGTFSLTISGMAPDDYNGLFDCSVTGSNTLRYSLAANPGQATAYGIVSYDVNMAEGYFNASTLVYRSSTGQIEINP